MKNNSMTAMMSLFAKANHQRYRHPVFTDSLSEMLITDEEYNGIYDSLSQGSDFFKTKSTEETINTFIAPTVIARSAFARQSLNLAIRLGAKRYMALGAGYDTIAYDLNLESIEAVEIDRDFKDKLNRLDSAGVNHGNVRYIESELPNLNFNGGEKITCCLMLGVSYYLSKKDFEGTVLNLASVSAEGSSLVFDYPTEEYGELTALLADGANEPMKERYSYYDMEKLLSDCGYKIYELLKPKDIEKRYFKAFNTLYKNSPLKAQRGVNLCLAVRK